ncbi:glycerate kinase [Anaerolentibacter hominis]|uniref:glycerate kinase type-2 family protein n=1 Tax=Anaerolentibacter hominis TaxID=3079009 RepID=UPI0031B89799
MMSIREDADRIIRQSIREMLPNEAVERALKQKNLEGNVVVVAVGKAGWTMGNTAKTVLGDQVKKGVIVTKYEHSQGDIEGFTIIEAGHPVPDENSVLGTEKAIEAVSGLTEQDTVVFLISGGGSALFERPLEGITLDDIQDVTKQLLRCGADIVEINTIRKHLSAVKAGRFAKLCAPAKVYAIVLSDVLGDRLDSIASGPAYPDSSTCEEALAIVKKYGLTFDERIISRLGQETPKELDNVETVITGSVSELCRAAAKEAEVLGYTPYILTSTLDCEAKEAGKMLSSIAREIKSNPGCAFKAPCAVIMGGETVVRITGEGLGGRNQELALSAADGIADLGDTVVFSIGSDGTDGPTDAAGGMVDGATRKRLSEKNLQIGEVLAQNDSYRALKEAGDLIITGPTGTNVNDVAVLLIK